MAALDDVFMGAVIRLIGEIVLERGQQAVAPSSKTLQRAMILTIVSDKGLEGKAQVTVPHYWAIFIHDGSNSVPPGTFMIWYRNPADDPRFPGRTRPERLSQMRRLSPEQLRRDLLANKVIVAKNRSNIPANRFFSNREGMFGVTQEVEDEVSHLFRTHLRKSLASELGVRSSVSRGAVGERITFGTIEDTAEGSIIM